MKIFGLSITRATATPPTQRSGYSPKIAAFLRGDDIGPSTALINAYEQVVWVYRAINVLAEHVANTMTFTCWPVSEPSRSPPQISLHRQTEVGYRNSVTCPPDHFSRLQGAQSRGGFSLLELLLVVAILVILVSLFGPSGAQKQIAIQNACRGNLEKIYMAMDIYSSEHAGKFPRKQGAQTSEEALSLLVPKYTAETSLFLCPASKNALLPPGQSLEQGRISYAYYMGRQTTNSVQALMSDEQVNTDSKDVGAVVFADSKKPPGINHGKLGGNFLFTDGHVDSSPLRVPFSLVLTQGVVLLNPKMK